MEIFEAFGEEQKASKCLVGLREDVLVYFDTLFSLNF